MNQEVKKGIYHHYKSGVYEVIGEAKNPETREDYIVYKDIKDEKKVWTRPKKIFLEEVEVKGKKKPRFEYKQAVEIESFENKYLRALADYQNLLKQHSKDKAAFIKYALEDFLYNLLPVYDHLKMSMQGLNEEEMKNPWAQGVGHVLKQFKEVLSNNGIEEVKTSNEKFDHSTMEAIEGSGETVKQEIMAGYKLNGKLIRPAKVIVK